MRISKQQWLYDKQDKVVDKLTSYVGLVTNLNMSVAEPWQVNYFNKSFNYLHLNKNKFFLPFLKILNYGIGGDYFPHYDFFLNVILTHL